MYETCSELKNYELCQQEIKVKSKLYVKYYKRIKKNASIELFLCFKCLQWMLHIHIAHIHGMNCNYCEGQQLIKLFTQSNKSLVGQLYLYYLNNFEDLAFGFEV